MLAICGEYSWKVRSTASPDEILRTIKDEFRPRLRLPITTPSYACTRLRVPSTTFTLTITVSPGPNTGLASPPVRRAISSCSRSEEHTSELQSLMRISYAVFYLKKKKIVHQNRQHNENRQKPTEHTTPHQRQRSQQTHKT